MTATTGQSTERQQAKQLPEQTCTIDVIFLRHPHKANYDTLSWTAAAAAGAVPAAAAVLVPVPARSNVSCNMLPQP